MLISVADELEGDDPLLGLVLSFQAALGIRFVIDREECFSHKAEYEGDTLHVSFVVIKSDSQWHFNEDGVDLVVSVFLLRSYEPPALVCAMNELLDMITKEASTLPTIVAPFFVAASKLKFNNRSLEANSRKASLHYFHVGQETETTRLFATRVEKPPPSMQIHHEPLSCLLHLARVKCLPTSILIGQRSSSVSHKALNEELQVIHETGELVASWTGLSFARDRIKWSASKTSKEDESPWRALYG
ncbi:hypothetical protein Bca52824_014685 [Brassica carinata]|uniref:DUF7894 domain-containing protein n=1 Tax=Brassica carinata TaxID=52824 RepID=A0A8X8B4N4_BRACI|nr:hypothetical protein Bca52824_014685 [Brassica carinata]